MTEPVHHSTFAALRYGRRHVDPPAANRWDVPAAGTPVILLHGFGMDIATSWFTVAPALANAGLLVFALNFGQFGHEVLTRPRRGSSPCQEWATWPSARASLRGSSTKYARWAGSLLGENLRQQAVGTSFLTALYRDGDTVPGVEYTMINPRWGTFTTPVLGQQLSGERAKSIRLGSRAEHVSALYDRAAINHIVAALTG